MTRVGYGDLLKVPNARWGKGGGVTWLLYATFGGGDQSAPLTSPLGTPAVEVGELFVSDTINATSITSGAAQIVAASGAGSSMPTIYTGTFARAAGLAAFVRCMNTVAASSVGWSVNTSVSLNVAAFYLNTTAPTYRMEARPAIQSVGVTPDNGYFDLAIVLRTSGAAYYSCAESKLLWIDERANDTPLRFVAGTIVSSINLSIDELGIRQLPAPFDTDYGIASQNVASPVSGTSYTTTADAITDLTLTAPNPLADQAGYRYRYTDDDNCWHSHFNSAGAYRLDSVAASVATNRINVAAVIAAAATVTMRTISSGSLHDAYTLAGTAWTKRGAQINVSHLNTNTAVRPYVTGSWAMSNLRSYPVTDPRYGAELNKT